MTAAARGRIEDRRLLTGRGTFVDDLSRRDLAHLVVVRSPHAHARILSIDPAPAAALPGVLAVLTGEDWAADGLGGIPTRTPARNSDGSPLPRPERPGLVVERVRFVGDAVAIVVATDADTARDAAEHLAVDYEPLPAVADARDALAPGAPEVWPGLAPGNVCVRYQAGDADAVERAFAAAAHVTELELMNQRVTAVPIEPRGAIGEYDKTQGLYTLTCATQNVHANRDQLATEVLGVERERLRIVAPDVGGGFGAKNPLYPEHALVLWAARRVDRPVKWINDRSESFLSDAHGRDQRSTVELALDGDGRFLALRTTSIGNAGAYLLTMGPFTPTGGTARTQGGPYRIPAAVFRSIAAFTHTAPTDPYRGAGRPEASYQIERVVDVAAAETGRDPIELRRINLLRPAELPWTNGVGTEIECGDFPALLDRALELADHAGFATRAETARALGRTRGFGISTYLECSGGGAREHAVLAFDAAGRARVAVGSQSTGTGHETTLTRLVAERLGTPVEAIDFVQGDTSATPHGGGHGGSRALETGGSAVLEAAERAVENGRRIAAHLLAVEPAEVEFARGHGFRAAAGARTLDWAALARAAADPGLLPPELRGGLDVTHQFERPGVTFPNGCHAAEVDVDPDTGEVRIVRYTAVDDFGRILNEATTAGQVTGGVAQGIGQALGEAVAHDPETAQILSGSLLDYALPRADTVPRFTIEFDQRHPSAHNPLGAKGCGEAGCCGALAAVVNAVIDALGGYGVRHIEMPLGPERVWRAARDGAERA